MLRNPGKIRKGSLRAYQSGFKLLHQVIVLRISGTLYVLFFMEYISRYADCAPRDRILVGQSVATDDPFPNA